MLGYFRVMLVFFSIVKYVSHGFFRIQILPKSITTGGEYGTPFPIPHNSQRLRRLATMSVSGLYR